MPEDLTTQQNADLCGYKRHNTMVIFFASRKHTLNCKLNLHVLIPSSHMFYLPAQMQTRKGVLTAIRDTVAFRLHKEVQDLQGRYHILLCDLNSTTYTVGNVYAPNVHQSSFIHKLMKKVSQIQKGHLILCGNFNLSPDPKIDSSSLTTRKNQTLQPLLWRYNIYDAWRCLNVTEREYSFFSTSHKIYTRLNLFMTNKWLLTKIRASKINDITWTDHASVSLLVDDISNVNFTFI